MPLILRNKYPPTTFGQCGDRFGIQKQGLLGFNFIFQLVSALYLDAGQTVFDIVGHLVGFSIELVESEILPHEKIGFGLFYTAPLLLHSVGVEVGFLSDIIDILGGLKKRLRKFLRNSLFSRKALDTLDRGRMAVLALSAGFRGCHTVTVVEWRLFTKRFFISIGQARRVVFR